jgi:hypothetical protein
VDPSIGDFSIDNIFTLNARFCLYGCNIDSFVHSNTSIARYSLSCYMELSTIILLYDER